ncbi:MULTISPECIES: hypothetical protein [unclassified Listeria]|uniref:hypothetical protein n=1 Tax=unclassified Listeria TaxID=2642072 RepID=UPI0013563462|nr:MULTISPECIES: hypothetical protein [unclassified Listeria]
MQLFKVGTKSELMEYPVLEILEGEAQAGKAFYILRFANDLEIGLISDDQGIFPVIQMVSDYICVFSLDTNIYRLDTKTQDITSACLDSLIFEIYVIGDTSFIVCEIDIYAFNTYSLVEKWHISLKDIVIDSQVDGEILVVDTDEKKYKIDLIKGTYNL